MPKPTYRVAHILVSQKFEAEDLLRKLKDGEDFALLAQKFSTCPSRAQGGDLGPIAYGKADPDFEEASTVLKVGQMTLVPIRTRFGYHLIKRME